MAKALLDNPNYIDIHAFLTDEQRFLVIVKIDERNWSEVIVCRSEDIKIISGASRDKRRLISIKAKEIKEKFDIGEDISMYLDVSKAHRPEQEP